ncbi:hypothetical protein K458DRAFT_6812 [Lentithecium fluviatile CBS 122367]|uniref:Uncharacterized protein n=1 Tax=Lentithecium fluviatile CBS 122367 TaxID=1168545 RepID=A0A6G1JNZ4_9PLEO|nr:hypothetical protein K458DRAFT_6812 [Lentithecium fluviatile CBS 122367]
MLLLVHPILKMSSTQSAPVSLPRVAITYCTQCRWMLRAAYFGQELLSTFGTQIGEIALVPATGGLFTVELVSESYIPPTTTQEGDGDGRSEVGMQKVLLWDRKTEGGFPETKVLKQRVRDCIEPGRDLGHSDKGGKKKTDEGGKVEEGLGGEGRSEEGKVDGNKEQGQGKKMEKKGAGGEGVELRRNADGTVCEDCA